MNKADKNKRKKPLGRNKRRVEKTIQIVKTDFVGQDEFNNIEEPLPGVSIREIKKKKRRQQQQASEEKAVEEVTEVIPEQEIRKTITITKTEPANENSEDVDNDEIVEPEVEEAEPEPEKKRRKKKKELDDDTVNFMDIRAARQKEKRKKRLKKIIAVGVVAVFAAGVYATRATWVPKLEGILDRPHDTIINDGKTESGNFPISFDENAVNEIQTIDNQFVRIDDNHITLYTDNGEAANTFAHNYSDPILKSASKRMLVYDNGGNNFEVLNKKNQVYEKTTEQQILFASIANNSNVAVVTQTEKYASVLTIYDSNGSEIYSWSSNMRVLDVTFTKDGSGCYISTFSATGGEIQSVIHTVSFGSTEELVVSVPLDTLVLGVKENMSGDLWVVGDTEFYKLDNSGHILIEYEYTNDLVDFALSDSCAAVVVNGVQRKTASLAVFSSDADMSTPDNVLYSDGGNPKTLRIDGNKIMLLKENNIEAYDTSGNLLATASVSTEYVDFTFLNDNIYFLGYREINKIAFST